MERLGGSLRRIGMRMRVVGTLLVVPLVLAGCGDGGGADATRAQPSSSGTTCRDSDGPAPVTARADLDGDGKTETVAYMSGPCVPAPVLAAQVEGTPVTAAVPGDLPVAPGDIEPIAVPGRDGDLLLVQQHHPRGGVQARLYGYAEGELDELTVDGQPVFDFVATDTTTDLVAAKCVDGGFVVLEAKPHTPPGVMAAWDVYRTSYAVDGNDVTKGATVQVAENVLDRGLTTKYAELAHPSLFTNCLARPGS